MTDAVRSFDVLIVGAGPAGIAAACAASECGRTVGMVDDNPTPGGQNWRGEAPTPNTAESAAWYRRLLAAEIDFVRGASVFAQLGSGVLLAESADAIHELRYAKLILATGARERFLPFPGWTLPNVMGAGGLQALVKSGLPISGMRVIVAGSGPLLLAVAAYLKKHGARVLLIAEQATRARLVRFAAGLLRYPGKLFQGMEMRRSLSGIPYLSDCWTVSAEGKDKLERATLRQRQKIWTLECDYLACGFHLVPNTELAELLGCELREGSVRVDEWQETSVAGVFCAGEPTGIGGLELALAEGQITGYAAAGQPDTARPIFSERRKLRRFALLLEETFRLRKELKSLPGAETIVCRCEDVTFERLRRHNSWRAAKLETRCGMGPCQGRVCGAAAEFLFGWQAEPVRPPVFPASVEALAVSAPSGSGSSIRD
jgi:NADPH-dependent 2,4-dienoyl-CoA reductase/sulfur reductase-like enzyme